MNISAVIFDLDGTVLSDEDEYGLAFKKVLQSLGAKVDSDYPQVGGIGVKENWPGLLKKYKVTTDKTLDELASQTQKEYLKLLDKVTLKPGLEDFIKSLRLEGLKIALATSNVWFILEKVFEKFPIEKLFDGVTTGEEVVNKKPAPDLFLKAAEKLGAAPSDCLVIEDAPSGVEAAHSAKMKVIALARNSEHAEILSEADLVIRGYNQLTSEVVLKI